MEAVAQVAPDLEARRSSTERSPPDAQKTGAPPPLPAVGAHPLVPSAAAPPPPLPKPATTAAPVAPPPALPALIPATPPSSAAGPQAKPAAAPSKPAPQLSAKPATKASPSEELPAPQRRRPAGPSRNAVAANDDVPTIGGLIYALEQKPSRKPFQIAAAVSGIWFVIAGFFAYTLISAELGRVAGIGELLGRPAMLIALASTVLPIGIAFGVAWLLYHAEDLRLRSSAMTEVAIRLAEPDRSAEQAVASLGQSVRKQVGYMNEAISQAIGRAGELEAMVHNEVSALEQSFTQNETRIRSLLSEFANERNQLSGTSEQVHTTLRAIGDEVPALIEKLNSQQLKLSRIIENAGQNLIALETSLTSATGQLEGSLATRTEALRGVLTDTTAQIGTALSDGTDKMKGLLTHSQEQLQTSFSENAGQVQTMLVDRTNHLQTVLDEYTSALHASLGARTGQLQTVFEEFTLAIDSTLETRSQGMQAALMHQTERFDATLIERTKALDQAFASRLQVLDDSIHRSSLIIDGAVGEKARLLTAAMETHAKQLADTLGRQSQNLDETLLQGINSVRRTSENITRQSVKAIEGLSGQADMLKNVSENLLSQIGTVTTRFENQGQSILRAANALEGANYRIDQTLQTRHRELNETLGRVTESTDHLGQQMLTYRSNIDTSLTDAAARAKSVTEELTRTTESHAQQALSELQRLKADTDQSAGHALASLRTQVTNVSREMQNHVGSMSSRISQTSDELRARSRAAQEELEREQQRLRAEAQKLPDATRESVDGMRRMLAEQMRALDQVQQIAGRAQSDISAPVQAAPAPRALPAAPAQGGPSLTAALAAANTSAQATTAPPANASGWSLGDLLARASKDEVPPVAEPVPQRGPAADAGAPINLEQIATALDAQTAGAIWTRFRSGQRGILVRSIYTAEGRAIFDDVSRRYAADLAFRAMIDRFMGEFERELRDVEARDRTGQQLQQHLVSSGGRVYLFLAHASGRLQ